MVRAFLAAAINNIHGIIFLGMPIQSTTDCGSETTFMYGMATALRFEASISVIPSFENDTLILGHHFLLLSTSWDQLIHS